MQQDLRLSLFKCLQAYESRAVGLHEVMRLIVHDADVEQKTLLYRDMAHCVSRDKANAEVKVKRMPAVSVGVLFKGMGRSAEQVAHATGLALCDLDDLTPEMLEDARQKIIADPHTLLCYTTISGGGLRVLYRYTRGGAPINCEAYPAAFLKGNKYYAQLTGCDYDKACSDYSRLSGLAHDAQAFLRMDSEPFVVSDEEMAVYSMAVAPAEPGKPRRTYDAGTCHASPEEAWPHVQRMLSRRGLGYTPGHRHDYMVHAVFLFNRFGSSVDDLLGWAAQEWGDMPAAEREGVIRHCYRHDTEHGVWRIRQPSEKRRHALLSTTEIRAWLSERCMVRYNVVSDQTVFLLKQKADDAASSYPDDAGMLSAGAWQVVDDRVVESMRCQMEADTDKRVLTRDVGSVLTSDFSVLVHPVRDYVSALPAWDGQDRVGTLATRLTAEPVLPGQTQEEAQQSLAWAFHKWLVAMVATWMSDNGANHQIFTIIGPQGIYKTTFFRFLLPPPLRGYFWENAHNSFASKDDRLALAENCLVEMEEVEAVTGRDMSELKALVTSESVKERRPYARYRSAKARLASFCASGNEQRFLTDLTGNRRWLCFCVSHIDDPRQWDMDYDQLYAQLRDEYISGFQYWFDKREEQRVERLNQPFRIASPEEQLITTRLRKPVGHEAAKLMNSTMIAMHISGGHLSPSISIRKIGEVMRQLGYTWKHRKSGDFYRVVEIPWNETQNYLSKDEDIESSENDPMQAPDNEQLVLPF